MDLELFPEDYGELEKILEQKRNGVRTVLEKDDLEDRRIGKSREAGSRCVQVEAGTIIQASGKEVGRDWSGDGV